MVATIYQLTTITEYGATLSKSTAIATVSGTGTLVGYAEAYTGSPTTYPEPTWRSSTTSTPPPHSVTEPPDENRDSGLSPGAIAGIAAGSSVAGVSLLLVAVYFFIRHRRQHDRSELDPFDIDTPAVVSVPNTSAVTPYTFPKYNAQLLDKPVAPDEAPPLPPPVPLKPARMTRPVAPRPIARTTLEKLEAEHRRQSQIEWQPVPRLERRDRVERRGVGGRLEIEKRPDNLRVQNPDSEPDPTPPPYDPAWSEGRH